MIDMIASLLCGATAALVIMILIGKALRHLSDGIGNSINEEEDVYYKGTDESGD